MYNTLVPMLESLWKVSNGFSVIDLENDYFLIKFKEESDVVNVPWVVLGNYLTVHPWVPDFDTSMDKLKSSVAWIRLPRMSLHYYYKTNAQNDWAVGRQGFSH